MKLRLRRPPGRRGGVVERAALALVRHLGWPALGALALCAIAAWQALHRLPRLTAEHERIARLHDQRIAEQRRAPVAPPVADEAASVSWLRALPSVAERGRSRRAARAQAKAGPGSDADYSLGAATAGALTRVEATLPLTGSYAQACGASSRKCSRAAALGAREPADRAQRRRSATAPGDRALVLFYAEGPP